MYVKLLSTGTCANINIREIMLISIISSASWSLRVGGGGGGGENVIFSCFVCE